MSKYETKYRVIENRRCNDFNDELPYTIITVDYDPKNDLIRTRGFANWGKNKNDLIGDRKEAERVFVNLMCKDIKNELIKECKEHQEAMQIADKRIKKLKNENADLSKMVDELKQQLKEKDNEHTKEMMAFEKKCQAYYNSKEFTIEQLEKVKTKVRNLGGFRKGEKLFINLDNVVYLINELKREFADDPDAIW